MPLVSVCPVETGPADASGQIPCCQKQLNELHQNHLIKEKKMKYFRKLAISAGILFIIYTSVDVLSFLFLGSLTEPNHLVSVSENAGLVGTGALLLIIGGLCASGIAISLYPVLKKYNSVLALGSVGFRISEGVLHDCFCVVLCWSIITLSQVFVKAGAPDLSVFPNFMFFAICRISIGWEMVLGRSWLFPLGVRSITSSFIKPNWFLGGYRSGV